MQDNTLPQTEKYKHRYARRKIWRKVVGSLACVVVFATTYMLILPAITMENTTYCGIQEHQHDAGCFEQQLICGHEESQEVSHTHDAGCYEAAETYICGETEGENGHTHGEDCVESRDVLICNHTGGASAHTHTDACYENVLTCGKEEHTHTLLCFSDPDADVETTSVWEKTLSNVELTGVWADDVVSIAQSQLGYRESDRNYTVAENDRTKGYTRYGAWYGDPYGDWCAMFVSFCLNYAEIPENYVPYEASCKRWVEELSEPEVDLYRSASDYMPVAGDIIFFDSDDNDVSDHVGIVAEVIEETETEPARLKTIEGNANDCVQYATYDLEDPGILGYGELPENPGDNLREGEFALTAPAEDGVRVRLTGPTASLPFPADEIDMTAEAITNEAAAALVDEAVADTELENGQMYLFDVRLWHDGTEIQPIGPVVLTFEGVASSSGTEAAGVFHVDEEKEQATDMNAELTEDGSVVVDTDHFSLYAIMVASDAGGTFSIDWTFSATWDDTNSTIGSVSFTASNSSQDNVLYRVEYSDNGGETWITAVSANSTVKKNVSVSMEVSALTDAPIDRIYRVYGAKDKKNYGYTASVTLYDILDSVKSGFSDWLENSYVQDFKGTALPTTTQELYQAFAVYYDLPTVTIKTSMDGNTMHVDAKTDVPGSYTYSWEYQDEDGTWLQLCEYPGSTITASGLDVLLDGGKNVRCKIYEDSQYKGTSNTLFVNPKRQLYDNAIAEINSGLNLGNLAINGTQFTDYFYYGNVAKDSRVPFYDAQSYADYLAKIYLDTGGGEAGLAAVKSEWDKYLYDIYDPSKDAGKKSNLNGGYPGSGSTYGDQNLGWPKDSASSFHGTLLPKVDDLNYDFLENGVDYSNFVSDLAKTATAVAPGDENTERKYDIDITADAQAKADGPVAMVLQIQTSWQMFDLLHANAVTGQGYTEVGALAQNTELATLYDIKQALLRFVDYMEENHPGGNLVLGITEVQHAKSQTMFSGTDKSGSALYVTNNYEVLRDGIQNWDSFGNCEHVHYDTTALVNATRNLADNLAGWKDMYGVELQYKDIQKVAVIIGGPTENTNSTNGYGCTLPWATFQRAGLNSVYSIRTNNGTPTNAAGVLSWLDNTANNTGAAFCDGTGTSFTEKYVATTEDAVFNYLVQIAEQEMGKKGIDVEAKDKYVENVTVSDTISDEFVLDTSEPITATVYNKDGSVDTQKTVALDDPDLSVTVNSDGTTTITYNFGTVYNTKKCVLHFRVQAKEDYIGSNNVYSNLGTPDATYQHTVRNSVGIPTGQIKNYSVDCYDTPQVNVPIRFTTVDGDTASIIVGESVNLKDLSTEIAKDAEDRVDNYDQINGTLSYTWVLPNGEEVDAGSVTVAKGSIGEQSFPNRSSVFEGTAAGQYTGILKVTFTPENVDGSNRNFSNEVTAVPVDPLTNPGNVWINVVDSVSTEHFYVRKEWVGDPPEGTDSITFRVLVNGESVQDDSGNDRLYTLEASNGWEAEISGLPSVVDGVIQNYTVEELNCPDGYLATYSSESRVEEDWAAKVTLSFTPSKDKDKVILKITYTYGSETRTYTVSGKQKYEKNEPYTFEVKDLPLNENGEPYSCEIISIVNTNDKNNPLAVSASSAAAKKYLRGSSSTEVKVITNAPAYELPQTGGAGTTPYAMGGLLLLAGSGSFLMYNHIKRRKEDYTFP